MRTGIDAAEGQVMPSLWLFPAAGLSSRLSVYNAEEAQGSWLYLGRASQVCGTTFCGESGPVPRPGWWVGCARAQAGLPPIKGKGS